METILSTREIAVLIWASVTFAATLGSAELRKLYIDLIHSLFSVKILVLLLAMLLYLALMVMLLRNLGIWDSSMIKDTIIWWLFTAFTPIFALAKTADDKTYFRKSFLEIIKVTVFIEFVVNYFTFSLIKELVLVPLMWAIAGMLAFAKNDQKYQQVNAVMKKLLKWISVAILFYVLFRVIGQYKSFFSWDTLKLFSISPLLSLLYLPFVYGLSLYTKYENAFIRMDNAIDSTTLANYAKRQAVIRFHFQTMALNRWTHRLFRHRPTTNNDIVNSIAELKDFIHLEKNPPAINEKEGWSPYVAKKFLEEKGFHTRPYDDYSTEEWSCSSDVVYMDTKAKDDYSAYYIEGNKQVVYRLELELFNATQDKEIEHLQVFANYASELYRKATGRLMDAEITVAILLAYNKSWNIAEEIISVNIHQYNNQEKWFEATFVIEKHTPDLPNRDDIS